MVIKGSAGVGGFFFFLQCIRYATKETLANFRRRFPHCTPGRNESGKEVERRGKKSGKEEERRVVKKRKEEW
jgi:hypothetical protein